MAADGHAQAAARAPVALAIQLEYVAVERDGVIASDGALILVAEDLIEVDRTDRDERARGIRGRTAEGRVVVGHEMVPQIGVGRRQRGDLRDPERVDESILKCAIQPLAPAAGLGRIGGDVLNAQPIERPAHLRQLRLVYRAFGLGRVERPVRAVRVDGHRQPEGRDHVAERRHDRGRRLTGPQLRVQHAFGGIVEHGTEHRALVWAQRQPGMRTAVDVQQFPKARARLPPASMPATGSSLFQQARELQRRFHEAVR
jgi:hypothetical protein